MLVDLLKDLPRTHARTERGLDQFYARFPTRRSSESIEAINQFDEIVKDLWILEHKIILKTQLVVLMTAIQVEELVNKFSVFNLPRELVETIERLSPAEKLTAGASALGRRKVRATSAYEAVQELMSWRNAFAHGHCVDRPTKSLRHNHLISPDEYPGVPDSIALMLKLTAGYTRLVEYIRKISINPYTRRRDLEWEDALDSFKTVARYKFSGGNLAYDVTFR